MKKKKEELSPAALHEVQLKVHGYPMYWEQDLSRRIRNAELLSLELPKKIKCQNDLLVLLFRSYVFSSIDHVLLRLSEISILIEAVDPTFKPKTIAPINRVLTYRHKFASHPEEAMLEERWKRVAERLKNTSGQIFHDIRAGGNALIPHARQAVPQHPEGAFTVTIHPLISESDLIGVIDSAPPYMFGHEALSFSTTRATPE